jgi:hypothetical protein
MSLQKSSIFSGEVEGGTESYDGTRMSTFMVYLSEVPIGGHTVFLQSGEFI